MAKSEVSRVFDASELKVAPLDAFNYKKSTVARESKMYGFLNLTPDHRVFGPKTYKDENGQLQVEKEQATDDSGNLIFDKDEEGNEVPRLVPVYDESPKKQVYIHKYQFRRPQEVNGRVVLADNSEISDEEIAEWLKPGCEISFTTAIHQDKGVFCLAWTCTHLINELKIQIMSRPNWRVRAEIERFKIVPDQETKKWVKEPVDRRIETVYTGGDLHDMKYKMNAAFLQAAAQDEEITFYFEKMDNCSWVPCEDPTIVKPQPAAHKPAAKKSAHKPAAKKSAAKKKQEQKTVS